MNKLMIVGAAALITVGASACTPRQIAAVRHAARHAPVTTVARMPQCVGSVVTVAWDSDVNCDVVSPQRLDQTYPTSVGVDFANADCDQHGGMLGASIDGWVCSGVDY